MECLRCGNTDRAYFYKGHNGVYCRKCIRFSRVLLEEELAPVDYEISEGADDYNFEYRLTDKQLEASHKVAEYIKEADVLLNCVCGAGKTEIVIETISAYLKKGLKVAYAIARKEVVIELEKRFRNIFSNTDVVSVYGNHHDRITGDLIVCTCHQLYRYHNTFDLLILDEADAFPLKGNDTLMEICLRSARGNIVYSTATVNEDLKKILKRRKHKSVYLYTRPSNRPLSVPKVIYADKLVSMLVMFTLLKRMNNQCLVFVSRKKTARLLYLFTRMFMSCDYVYSDRPERNDVIERFRNREFKYLYSTTVLERGVTLKGISVVLIHHDSCFDKGSIIQMLGRVGRGVDNDEGRSYIISNRFDKTIPSVIEYLKEANSYL